MPAPADAILDLFAVPGPARPLPGQRGPGHGAGHRPTVAERWVAGDLVLTPDRDPAVQEWLSPTVARLAVVQDERPGRRRRDLRIAMPVPARDGSWVVQGWAASRFEPGSELCHDPAVAVAAGQVLHAQLASVVRRRPAPLARRDPLAERAERLCFAAPYALLSAASGRPGAHVVRRVEPYLDDRPVGPDQLVHLALASSVLLDPHGAPVVLDLEPGWRPARWAEALALVEAVVGGAPMTGALESWRSGSARQAMLRALVYRATADPEPEGARYDAVLDALAPEVT